MTADDVPIEYLEEMSRVYAGMRDVASAILEDVPAMVDETGPVLAANDVCAYMYQSVIEDAPAKDPADLTPGDILSQTLGMPNPEMLDDELRKAYFFIGVLLIQLAGKDD